MKKLILLLSIILITFASVYSQRGGKGINLRAGKLWVEEIIKLGQDTILPFKILTTDVMPSNGNAPYITWLGGWGNTTLTHNLNGTTANGIYFQVVTEGTDHVFEYVVADHDDWDNDTITVYQETDRDGIVVTSSISNLFALFNEPGGYMLEYFNWSYDGSSMDRNLEPVPDMASYLSDGTSPTLLDLPNNQFYIYNSSGTDYLLFFKLSGLWFQIATSSNF